MPSHVKYFDVVGAKKQGFYLGQFVKRSRHGLDKCSLYKEAKESILHMVLHYPYIAQVWKEVDIITRL
jgi:hypothetical protein